MLDASQTAKAISPDATVVEAARVALESKLLAVGRNLPLAATQSEDDIEHVHQLRVSTRRALAALRQFQSLTPKKTAAKLSKLLKRIRRAAGRARDLDVLIQRSADRDSPRIVRELRVKRAQAQAPIIALHERLVDNDKLAKLTSRLLRKLDDSKVKKVAYRDWAEQKIELAFLDFLEASNQCTEGSTRQLHRFRIAAKRLRYDLELLTSALTPKGWPRALGKIEKLQNLLGEVNDHVVGVEDARKWLAVEDRKKHRKRLKQLRDREQAALADSLEQFHQWWTEARAEKIRAQFRELLSHE